MTIPPLRRRRLRPGFHLMREGSSWAQAKNGNYPLRRDGTNRVLTLIKASGGAKISFRQRLSAG